MIIGSVRSSFEDQLKSSVNMTINRKTTTRFTVIRSHKRVKHSKNTDTHCWRRFFYEIFERGRLCELDGASRRTSTTFQRRSNEFSLLLEQYHVRQFFLDRSVRNPSHPNRQVPRAPRKAFSTKF